jgi:hypothetical protein
MILVLFFGRLFGVGLAPGVKKVGAFALAVAC